MTLRKPMLPLDIQTDQARLHNMIQLTTEMSLTLISKLKDQPIPCNQYIFTEPPMPKIQFRKLVKSKAVHQMFCHQQDRIQISSKFHWPPPIFMGAKLAPKDLEISTQGKEEDINKPISLLTYLELTQAPCKSLQWQSDALILLTPTINSQEELN